MCSGATPASDGCPVSTAISSQPIESERPRAVRAADLPQSLGREDAPPAVLPARDPLELPELLERVDAHVGVRADAERDAAVPDPDGRQKSVSEVGLGRRAGADRRAAVTQQVELGAVRMGRVHDRRSLAEASAVREQLDRSASVLGEALLDLPRLLVGVDVQDELLGLGVPAELLEPVARAGTDGVGRDADGDPAIAQPLELAEVRGDRRLAHPLEAPPRIRDVKADEGDPGLDRCFGRCERGLEPEVVELADRREPRRAHLPIRSVVQLADGVGRLSSASASMPSRHAQKSPPAARPRSARWNAWLWALTKPGSVTTRATGDDTNLRADAELELGLRAAPPAAQRADAAAVRGDPGLRRAARPRPGRAELARRDRLRARRDHRPGRRLARAPLARRVRLREGRRPARRPPDDRRLRRAARRLRPAARGSRS